MVRYPKGMSQNVLHISRDGKTAICGQISTIHGIETTTNLKLADLERYMTPVKGSFITRCKKCACIEGVEVPQPVKFETHYKIPFNMKHLAKKCGMWWNKDSKTWYIPHFKNQWAFSPILSRQIEQYFAFEKEVV